MPLGSRITLTPIAAKRVSISAVWSGADFRLSLPPGCRMTTLVPFLHRAIPSHRHFAGRVAVDPGVDDARIQAPGAKQRFELGRVRLTAGDTFAVSVARPERNDRRGLRCADE
jgi:hypothetical protein